MDAIYQKVGRVAFDSYRGRVPNKDLSEDPIGRATNPAGRFPNRVPDETGAAPRHG
jgi:hypothetical protein